MAQSIKMPALGESVTEGTVTAWLKQVGDRVQADEPIVEVATDKVDSEVPSPISGTVLKILVPEDATVAVGTDIALIGEENEIPLNSPAPSTPSVSAAPAAPVAPAAPSAPAAPAMPALDAQGDLVLVEMPALGESVTEGTVTAWLKQIGDKIEVDEPIVEVATDKVDSEVPSPIAGYLAEIRVQEDQTVNVGTAIAAISPQAVDMAAGRPGTAVPAPAAPAAPSPVPAPAAPSWTNAPSNAPADAQTQLDKAATDAASAGRVVAEPQAASAGSPYVTPLVRKLARDNNVSLASIQGTGLGGRIRKEDVLAAAEAAAAPKPEAPAKSAKPSMGDEDALRGTTQKMSRLRQTIAKRMLESLQTSAQLTTVVEVDVTRVAEERSSHKDEFLEKNGTKLTFLPFFVKAAIEALQQHPKINASISGDQVTYYDHENIGIAVDAPRGLMVPVIKDAGELDIAGIAHAINDLAAKTREGRISPDELSGSTFTVTNTGSGGALFDTPVLNLPEVAILGVGAIVRRPVVTIDSDGNEAISIRSMVYLSLSYDHRLVDGADASRYLMSVKRRLEEGDFDADLGFSK